MIKARATIDIIDIENAEGEPGYDLTLYTTADGAPDTSLACKIAKILCKIVKDEPERFGLSIGPDDTRERGDLDKWEVIGKGKVFAEAK